jgi:hypothetical protein
LRGQCIFLLAVQSEDKMRYEVAYIKEAEMPVTWSERERKKKKH